VHIYDPLEAGLPAAGRYRISDGVQDLQLYTGDKALRQHYQQRFASQQDELRKLCRQQRMHLLPVCTQDDVLGSLQKGLGVGTKQHSQYRAAP
jgi:hypothetical protein